MSVDEFSNEKKGHSADTKHFTTPASDSESLNELSGGTNGVNGEVKLQRQLKNRHIAMISIGGT